jgi:hypothetical protein
MEENSQVHAGCVGAKSASGAHWIGGWVGRSAGTDAVPVLHRIEPSLRLSAISTELYNSIQFNSLLFICRDNSHKASNNNSEQFLHLSACQAAP